MYAIMILQGSIFRTEEEVRSKALALVLLASLLATGALAGAPVHRISGGGTTFFDVGTKSYGFVAGVDNVGEGKVEGDFFFAAPPLIFHIKIAKMYEMSLRS